MKLYRDIHKELPWCLTCRSQEGFISRYCYYYSVNYRKITLDNINGQRYRTISCVISI